jgi:predicted nicotinamide N-methyase
VLELGSGLGLCGIVAAHISSSTILSDFDPWLVFQLQQNIEFNRNSLGNNFCEAKILDWDKLDEVKGIEAVDIIIGSEIVHEPNMGIAVFNAIDRFLKPNGLAFLMMAGSKNRYGMDKFLDCLQKSGFEWNMERISEGYKLARLENIVQEDMNEIYLHSIRKK